MPKISALSALAAAALTGAALMVAVDTTDLSMAGTGTTKKITAADVRTKVLGGGTGFTATDPLNVGVATFAGNVTPSTDNARSLGTAGLRWSDFRTVVATVSGLLTTGTLTVNAGDTNITAGNLVFTANNSTVGFANNFIKFNNSTDTVSIGTSAGTARLSIVGATAVFTVPVSGVTTLSTGAITSTVGNSGTMIVGSTATTGVIQLADITNTGGRLVLGIESSVGNGITAGTTAYATVLGSISNTATEIGTNNAIRLSISGAGAFDFKSNPVTGITTLRINGAIAPTGSNKVNFVNGDRIAWANGDVIWADGTDTFVKSSGTGGVKLLNSSAAVILKAYDGGFVAIGVPAATNGCNSGDLVLANNKAIRASNNAASGVVQIILLNATDQVVLSPDGQDIKWARANIALGGGAAPTLGTIGGGGPAAAAQRNWLRFIESDGTASFIPVWR